MKIVRMLCLAGTSVLLLAVSGAALFSSPGISKADKPMFSKDVAPIIFSSCTSCHRPGEVAPFSLLTYQDVQKRARQIAAVTEKRIMPPWKLDSHGEFQDERRLTDAQIDVLKQWVKEGTLEGNKADLPFAPKFTNDWTLGRPDTILQPSAAYHVAAEGRDVYRCFVVPTHFDEDRYVSAIDARPGNRAVVHHLLVYTDTTGSGRKLDKKETEPGYSTGGGIGFLPGGMLGGWAPGARPTYLPAETGILLPKGADVILEVHYHKDGKPETDLSQVAVYFSKTPIERPLHILPLANPGLRIPPDSKDHEERASIPVPIGVTLYTLFPHMHNLGRQMTVTATLPDKTKQTLVHVPDWDFNWQGFYAYKKPVKLPAGSQIDLIAHYDNSADNPRNPNSPPKEIRWGEQTTDEMCLCFLGFTIDAELLPRRKAGGKTTGVVPARLPADDNASRSADAPPAPAKTTAVSDPLTAAKDKKAVALIFLGTDCPISNGYAPEIKRICEQYTKQNIAFYLVYPDPDTTQAAAEKHAKEYGYSCPVLLDAGHRLTRKTGVTMTPQAAVLAPDGKLLYRGRIDNLYVDFGKSRYEATQHDLRVALDAIVQGKPVPQKFTTSIGCFIPEIKQANASVRNRRNRK